jgi:hypothetical protein
MNYQFNIGDQVIWRGGWGTRGPALAKIIDLGEKNGEPVYDLDNGHWAYEHQLGLNEEPSLRDMLKMSLILAITAPTDTDSDKAVAMADRIALQMDGREVREVQQEVEREFGGQP